MNNKILLYLSSAVLLFNFTSIPVLSMEIDNDNIVIDFNEDDNNDLKNELKDHAREFLRAIRADKDKDKKILKSINNLILSPAFIKTAGYDKDLKKYIDLKELANLINQIIDAEVIDKEAIDEELLNRAIKFGKLIELIHGSEDLNDLFVKSNLALVIMKVSKRETLSIRDIVQMFNTKTVLEAIQDEQEREKLANLLEELKREPKKPGYLKTVINKFNPINRFNLSNENIWRLTGATASIGATLTLWSLGHALLHDQMESLEPTGALATGLAIGTATATGLACYCLNKNSIQLNIMVGKLRRKLVMWAQANQ